MPTTNTDRMLAPAPGGWDRCSCRMCRIPGNGTALRRSARSIERLTVAEQIADALDLLADPIDDEPVIAFEPHVLDLDDDLDNAWRETLASCDDLVTFAELWGAR